MPKGLRGLAGLPGILPLPGNGEQQFSPIHVEDLARSIVHFLAPSSPKHVTLAPCGPEIVTLKEIVLRWRRWLGLDQTIVMRVPMGLVHLVGRIADHLGGGPLSKTAIRQLEVGNAGNGADFAEAIDFAPAPMRTWLARRPSSVQDKWHARLYFLRPLLRWTLGLSWVAAGVIGVFAAADAADRILRVFGWESAAVALRWLTCLLDVIVGIAVLARLRPSFVFGLQAAIIVGYTIVISIAIPTLWLDPFGALVKNAVFLALVGVVAVLEDDR